MRSIVRQAVAARPYNAQGDVGGGVASGGMALPLGEGGGVEPHGENARRGAADGAARGAGCQCYPGFSGASCEHSRGQGR